MSKDLVVFTTPSLPEPIETFGPPDDLMTKLDGKDVFVHKTVLDLVLIHPGHLDGKTKEEKARLKPHVGRFFNEAMEKSFDQLRLLPIAETARGRRLYSGTYSEGDRELECYSVDGEFSSPRMKTMPVAARCGHWKMGKRGLYLDPECEKAKWYEEGGKHKCDCSEYFKVAFLDLDWLYPLEIQFKGTMISAWKAFERSYQSKKTAAKIIGNSIDDYIINVTTDTEGTYSTANFTFQFAGEEKPSKYAALRQWYLDNVFIPRIKEEEDALAEQNAASAVDYDINAQGTDDANTGPTADAGQGFEL